MAEATFYSYSLSQASEPNMCHLSSKEHRDCKGKEPTFPGPAGYSRRSFGTTVPKCSNQGYDWALKQE